MREHFPARGPRVTLGAMVRPQPPSHAHPHRPRRAAPVPLPAAAPDADLVAARTPIVWKPDAAALAYLDGHLVDTIDTDAILRWLGVPAATLAPPKVPRWDVTAVDRIEVPPWGRGLKLPTPTPIEPPALDEDLLARTRRPIVRPRWGRDMRLPVVDRIEIPTVQPDGRIELPREPVGAEAWGWIDGADDEPEQRPRAPRPARKTAPPKHAAKSRPVTTPKSTTDAHAESLLPSQRPSTRVQKPSQPVRSARSQLADAIHWAPRVTNEASPSPLPTPPTAALANEQTANGTLGCLGRFVGLGALLAVAWGAVDVGLELWVESQEQVALRLQVAGVVGPQRLPGLVAVGAPDGAVAAVLACDVTAAPCRRALGDLLAWAEADEPAGAGPDTPKRRLLLLQRPADDGTAFDVAVSVHALAVAGRAPEVWQALAGTAGAVDGALPVRLARQVGIEPSRLARDREDPKLMLQVRNQRTMAAALGMTGEVAVTVAGLPIAAAALAGRAQLHEAADRHETALQVALAAHGDNREKAHRALLQRVPARERERYLAWIVRGRRVGP